MSSSSKTHICVTKCGTRCLTASSPHATLTGRTMRKNQPAMHHPACHKLQRPTSPFGLPRTLIADEGCLRSGDLLFPSMKSLFENEPPSSTLQSRGSSSSYLETPISHEAYVKVSPPCDGTEVYYEAQENVNKIFEDRAGWIKLDNRIHHFSWTGQYVYGHSATSPSDSLSIIMATPKNINPPNMLRVKAVVNCAFQRVDPVIVLLDDTADDLLQLRGAKLAQASEGRVYKFYSPHGNWMEDPRDSSDDAITDFGCLRTYEARCFEIGNGFVESSAIRTLGQWVNEIPITPERKELPRKRTWMPRLSPLSQSESATVLESTAIRTLREGISITPAGIQGLPRKRTWSPQSSPLSQSETAPVLEAQQEVKSNSPKQARRRRPRKIPTCVKEEVPHVYYSFPEPEPEFGKSRLRAIKKAIKAVFYSLKSQLLS